MDTNRTASVDGPTRVAPAGIPRLLETLRETAPPAEGVLTAVLATTASPDTKEAYLLAFRDDCKAVREGLPDGQRDAFNRAAARADDYLAHEAVPNRAGIALYAAAEPVYFYVANLPQRPRETVAWSDRPALEPLEQALDDYERVAVALFDTRRARLLTVYMDAIEREATIVDEVSGKQDTGGWFALAQSRYARHREQEIVRHAERTVRALMEMLRTRPFDRLLIAGPDEARAVLQHHLPRPLRARLAGTLDLELFAPDAVVLQAVRQSAHEVERREETAAVRELIDAKTTPHAALGIAATLAALDDGRVHRLLIAEAFHGAGTRCRACGRLVAGVGPCDACAGPTEHMQDLREEIIARARAQGARVEIVSGDAEALLLAEGGIGAWTRFAPPVRASGVS